MVVTLLIILVSTILSSCIVALFLPRVVLMSLRKKLLDPIDPRKVHKSMASRLGGMSFFPAVFVSFAIFIFLLNRYQQTGESLGYEILIAMASLMMLYFIGLYDDIMSVKFRLKFAVQITSATILFFSGIYIKSLYGVGSVIVLPIWIAMPLSVLLIVYITNAINLIDGINGLASMLSIIALIAYGVIFFSTNNYIYAAICFITVGALVPFFYHNVFGVRPNINTRIFMGDCGSMVIGSLLAIMAIKVWNMHDDSDGDIITNTYHTLAYTVLFVPCIDVIRVILRRVRSKQPIFLPDKNHIHHRFMALGFSPKHALLIIVVIQVSFLILNILLAQVLNIIYIFTIDTIIWIVINMIITRKIANKQI